jgi:hypothetical protein
MLGRHLIQVTMQDGTLCQRRRKTSTNDDIGSILEQTMLFYIPATYQSAIVDESMNEGGVRGIFLIRKEPKRRLVPDFSHGK